MREKFAGKPEHVVNYLFLLAEEVRGYMARLGFRTFQEMIGCTEKLRANPSPDNPKAKLLDFGPILTNALELRPGINVKGGSVQQEFNLKSKLVGGICTVRHLLGTSFSLLSN